MNIRELNNWIIDFTKLAAYRYIGGDKDVFEQRNYRIVDATPDQIEYKKLPRHIRVWLRAKYPGLHNKWGI